MSRWFRRTGRRDDAPVGLMDVGRGAPAPAAPVPHLLVQRQPPHRREALGRRPAAGSGDPDRTVVLPRITDTGPAAQAQAAQAQAAQAQAARAQAAQALPLAGGRLGGLPSGGGLPCGGQLFGPETEQVAMPWRGSGGQAHPMAAVGRVFPGYGADLAGAHRHCGPPAGRLPAPEQVPGHPRPIFERALGGATGAAPERRAPQEMEWAAVVNPPRRVAQRRFTQSDAADLAWRRVPRPQAVDWGNAPTRELPVVRPARRLP